MRREVPNCESKNESFATKMFKSVGWEVKENDKVDEEYNPDLTLYLTNGDLAGYVEVIKEIDAKKLADKLILIKDFFTKKKPRVFIITDFYDYYVYVQGEGFSQYKNIPSPESYPFLVQLIYDYVDYLEKKENKDE